ncbi:hypothetical protein ACG7TL_004808 [Trametes sanguinea]
MIFTTVLVYCLCALVAVLQSTSPDAFFSSITSAFHTPALSAFTDVFHLAGYILTRLMTTYNKAHKFTSLAPRPTLSATEVDSSIDSLLNNIKINHNKIHHDYVLYARPLEVEVELELGNSGIDGLSAGGYSPMKISRRFLRPAAAVLMISLSMLILCSLRTVHQTQIPKKSQRTLKTNTTTRMRDIIYQTPTQNALRIIFPAAEPDDLAQPLPAATAVSVSSDAFGTTALELKTASVYDALFDSSPGTVIFEPITEPLDMVGQPNDIFVANAVGYAVIELEEGQQMFAPFDPEEVHILDTDAPEEEAWQTYLWNPFEWEESGEEELSNGDHG